MELATYAEPATEGASFAALVAEGGQEAGRRVSLVTHAAEAIAALGIVGRAAGGMDVASGCTSSG